MRKYLFLLIVPILTIFSCVDDTSSYVSQEKENVDVEGTTPNGGEEEPPVDGELTPGVHLVKLNVTQPDGQVVERRFKYFMPSTLVTSKPISLIFEFHGSYEFEKDELPSDPIDGITKTNALCQLASRENCIVCFPAGEVVVSSDGSGAVNWQNSENHLPFVDAMLDFFKTSSPSVDPKRIYSTGQSSGAIFSFVLAFYRSGDFAAITPRAGQMSIENQTDLPSRAVPVRVFAGEIDDIVQHSAVLKNMEQWAIRIGGYFPGDMVLKELAKVFLEAMEKEGKVCRWGGEEFLFVFQNKNGDQANEVLHDILKRIRGMGIPYQSDWIHVTMTFGLEEYSGEKDMETIIRAADQKLYHGKENGRNQIVY